MGRRIVLRGCQHADLFCQQCCFGRWRYAQFVSQQAATYFVLRQSGAALAGVSKHAHQLAMGMLTQRVEFEQAAHIRFRFRSVASAFVEVSQLFQRSGDLKLQALSLEEEPLVKGWAVRERKTIQEMPTHQCHRLVQTGSAFGTILRLPWMRVGTASFDQVSKESYIQFVPAKGIELQIEAV